ARRAQVLPMKKISPLLLFLLCGTASAQAPDFETHVLPVLTRSGCNSGACHGAAIGRGGVRLSLLRYDPAAGSDSLIHESQGRRVHLVQAEKSLVLRKPTMQVPHEGGHKLGNEGHTILLNWIKAGAPREPRRRLDALDVSPTRYRFAEPGRKFALNVV